MSDGRFFGFTEVSPQEIKECADRFESTALFALYHDYALNNMLAGGIIFEIDGTPLEPNDTRLMNEQWNPFIRQLVASHWKWGIAAVALRDHGDMGYVPMVLNLARVSVRIRDPVDGVTEYLFISNESQQRVEAVFAQSVKAGPSKRARFSRTAPAATTRGAAGRVFGEDIISNVIVFESAPPVGSSLRSKIKTLMADLKRHDDLAETNRQMMHMLKHPQLITEVLPDPGVSSGNVAMAVSAMVPGQPEQATTGVPETSESKREDQQNIFRAFWHQQLGHMPPPSALPGVFGGAEIERVGTIDLVHLPEGRKVATQIERQLMQEYSELEIKFEELVGAVLGVPRAMWAQGMVKHTSSSEDNRIMFDRSQQALKQSLLPQLHTIFMAIYDEVFFVNKAMDAVMKSTSVIDIEQIVKKCSETIVDISLPGVPPMLELKEFYAQGVLSYDAYCLYISQAHGIPRRHMNAEPDISVRDLNGLPPLETEITTTDESKGNQLGTNTTTTTSQRTRLVNQPTNKRKRDGDEGGKGGGGGGGDGGGKYASLRKKPTAANKKRKTDSAK